MIAALGSLFDLTLTRLSAPGTESSSLPAVERASGPSCRARMAALLARHAHHAGQSHALSRDAWRVLWASGGRAFVPFHERAFSLVAWRDPVGPEEARAGALRLFRDHASIVGKHAVVLGASEASKDAAVRAGFGATFVGTEQRFALQEFHTRGKAGEKLRLARNHVRRAGAVAREIDPRTNEAHRRALEETERVWKLARPERQTRSFLRTDPLENASMRRYFAVEREVDGETRFESFLVCAPVSARGWYLQDLVRRPDAPRGAAEWVSLFAMETLRDEGFDFATMGIVPLFDPNDAHAPSEGIARWCIRRFDRHYGFAGLQQFRAKFVATEAQPMFALYWPRVLTPMAVWDIVAVTSR